MASSYAITVATAHRIASYDGGIETVPLESKPVRPSHAHVSWESAVAPFVLAIDIGSSSVRALVFDAAGRQIDDSEHQQAYRLHSNADGASEADPQELFDLVVTCVDGALTRAGGRGSAIAAVATSSFWHSIMGLDTSGEPTSPVYMWSDTRAGVDVPTLAESLDPERLHRDTGCRFHSSYWPAKLLWLRRTQPERVHQTSRWCSFVDYVDLRLRGELVTSISMASGTGLLRISDSTWHSELMDALDIAPEVLPPLVDRHQPLPSLLPEWRTRWPALAEVPWYPALGDGAAANVGTGAAGRDRIAVTIGTSGAMRIITDDRVTPEVSLNDRIWSYRLDRHHRVTGGALSNGGNVTGWIADSMAGGQFDEITQAASNLEPDSHGLTVLPLLAGERSPSWNDDASGVFAGLTLATRPEHLFRAVLEATAYRFASIHEALLPFVESRHDIIANGAAALKSPLWMQIIADTLGEPVRALAAEAEASARGVAVAALVEIGALPSIRPDELPVLTVYDSDPAATAVYRNGRRRHDRLERAMASFWRFNER